MRRLSLCLALTSLAATLVVAAPATAESGHKDKPVGDAPAAIDITGIDATNDLRRVKVRLEVPGLTRKGLFTLGYESDRYDGMAILVRGRRNGVTWHAFHCNEESCDRVECPGTKVSWDVAEKYVAVSVPQSCYPLRVPDAWNFNGHSDLGRDYDSEYTRLRLARG